ncbi:MAG: PHB depolymerase family esterase [bacterium]|nr:PHB depolymerase family esterase [bacterium]
MKHTPAPVMLLGAALPLAAALLLAVAIALTAPEAGGIAAAQSRGPVRRPGSIQYAGLERTYRIHLPSSAGRTGPMPLVLALHGGGGTGLNMEQLTLGGLNRLSETHGFVVVYPDGVDRHWNDGRGVAEYRAHRENVDDVGFISALIEHLAQTQGIDRSRVYATGISNGGLLSMRLAHELSHKIAAIAPVAISITDKIAAMRAPARPIPIVLIPGTHDPLVPWDGGNLGFRGGRAVGRVLSVAETVRYWVSHNRCAPTPTVTREPDRDPNDGTRVRRETYGGCSEGAEVVVYVVEGGGHTWPGGLPYLPERVIGRTTRDIYANEVIWDFFRRHAVR